MLPLHRVSLCHRVCDKAQWLHAYWFGQRATWSFVYSPWRYLHCLSANRSHDGIPSLVHVGGFVFESAWPRSLTNATLSTRLHTKLPAKHNYPMDNIHWISSGFLSNWICCSSSRNQNNSISSPFPLEAYRSALIDLNLSEQLAKRTNGFIMSIRQCPPVA